MMFSLKNIFANFLSFGLTRPEIFSEALFSTSRTAPQIQQYKNVCPFALLKFLCEQRSGKIFGPVQIFVQKPQNKGQKNSALCLFEKLLDNTKGYHKRFLRRSGKTSVYKNGLKIVSPATKIVGGAFPVLKTIGSTKNSKEVESYFLTRKETSNDTEKKTS